MKRTRNDKKELKKALGQLNHYIKILGEDDDQSELLFETFKRIKAEWREQALKDYLDE